MQRTLFLTLVIILIILVVSTHGNICPCSTNAYTLQCFVTNTWCTLNTNMFSSYYLISITYSGTAVLELMSSSKNRIIIEPVDDNDLHTIQISNMSTNATSIEIQIRLSLNQQPLPLFIGSGIITAPISTLSITVNQSIPDASAFQILNMTSSSTMNFLNYELIFDNSSANSGILNFPNLIYGFINLSSLTISGNNHILRVDQSTMPSWISINQLSLKGLRLYDQILYNITNLVQYSIEECEYNKTALFLNSNQIYSLVIMMKNNNPLNSALPNDALAFRSLGTVTSITLIEPKLNSSCLRAFMQSVKNIYLSLGLYSKADLDYWIVDRPLVWWLTINNISTLDIFQSGFFNKLDAIHQVTLQGTFELEKNDVCAFAGININPSSPQLPIVVLDSSAKSNSNEWDPCADTYVTAINIRTIEGIKCPPNGTPDNCEQWAEATDQCKLIPFESTCSTLPPAGMNYFFYNNSLLYQYFQQKLWLNQQTTSTNPPISKPDLLNIGAIIGAICGLIVAIVVLGITIFCIRRYRQKDSTKHIWSSTPGNKYAPSANDLSHVSIATSKTSQSSRYALQKSFFPPMHPNDEIAPPLYSAPSEAATSVSAYNLPSAPPAPRDSVSTRATTHVYESLDS